MTLSLWSISQRVTERTVMAVEWYSRQQPCWFVGTFWMRAEDCCRVIAVSVSLGMIEAKSDWFVPMIESVVLQCQ